MASRGLFIAGTSTEVGKTHVAAMIARALVAEGRRIGVYKPVASGCRVEGNELIADDAVALWEAAGRPGELERVCPQRFKAPLAPSRAATVEGTRVDAALLRSGLDYWRERSELILVEGAGGLMSPLSNEDYTIDVARDFGLPLVIVAANELGVINATLQTIITARAKAPELAIAGVVLNQVEQHTEDESLGSNADELAERCDVPVLEIVNYRQHAFDHKLVWL